MSLGMTLGLGILLGGIVGYGGKFEHMTVTGDMQDIPEVNCTTGEFSLTVASKVEFPSHPTLIHATATSVRKKPGRAPVVVHEHNCLPSAAHHRRQKGYSRPTRFPPSQKGIDISQAVILIYNKTLAKTAHRMTFNW